MHCGASLSKLRGALVFHRNCLGKRLGHQMYMLVLPYSRKLLKEKTFMDFSLMPCQRTSRPQILQWKFFANSHKNATFVKVFPLKFFPLYSILFQRTFFLCEAKYYSFIMHWNVLFMVLFLLAIRGVPSLILAQSQVLAPLNSHLWLATERAEPLPYGVHPSLVITLCCT